MSAGCVFALEHIVNGLLVGSYYIVLALGLSLIFSLGGVVNLAHGAFYARRRLLRRTRSSSRLGFVGAVVHLAGRCVGAHRHGRSRRCSSSASTARIRRSACCSPSASPWPTEQSLRLIWGATGLPFSIPEHVARRSS